MYGDDIDDESSLHIADGDSEQLHSYVSQQKAIIKKAQEKLEQCKRQYKADKAACGDNIRKKRSLDTVKVQIEERVNKINVMVQKVRQLERKLRS